MAAKRKSLPAPAAAQSSSSDDDSSSDAEQYVTQRNPSRAETPKLTERDDDESDSDSGSESDPNPPIKTLKTPQKPSESEDSSEEDEEEQEEVENLKSPAKTLKTPQNPSKSEDSSEEDEEEQEQVEKPKSPAKEPESQPDKKKQKLSTPDHSPSKKSSMIQRIWSPEDEMALLRALAEYQVRNDKLPPRKDYASFLLGISGSIGFPVTEKQLVNKIRQMKLNYSQKKKKGSNINFSQPHEKAVFDLCTNLFEDGSNASKKGASQGTNCDAETKSGGKRKKGITDPGSVTAANGGTATIDDGVANGGVVNGAGANGGDVARSHFYLEGLIKDMISTERCPGWLSTVEGVVAWIGELRAHDLEEKTKMLRIDTIKLHAREEKLMAELFDILADEMVDD